ncbi:hypothetical protein [Hyphomicrobium sp. CS1BSMeth3]|uniref:hypothetical protein n=1 Tax=Hyphomicrobium sp. CS1BSMeth3 TaxID=1892844 RepID=UPI0009305B1C|nr:hypothetical protein [Hyphomicrobium sp. CS1BSMeth3]
MDFQRKCPPKIPRHKELRKRFGLFLAVVIVVLVLGVAKTAIHSLGLEFLSLNPLFTSAIAGAIFIIGFLLSSILSDYKEAERIPTEIRVALEGIHDDVLGFVAGKENFDFQILRDTLAGVVKSLTAGLGHDGNHADMQPALGKIDELSALFVRLDQLGMPANFIVRLRGAQDTLRRGVLRIYHIQRMQFVPSIHILVQTLVAAILFLLLFLKTEGSPESALIFGFVAYMFVYALYLISMLEQPFRKGHNSLDDVSLFLFREFEEKVK